MDGNGLPLPFPWCPVRARWLAASRAGIGSRRELMERLADALRHGAVFCKVDAHNTFLVPSDSLTCCDELRETYRYGGPLPGCA